MIRLGLPREPRWLRLAHGVRVRVKPLTTAIYEAARITGQRKAVALAAEQGLIDAAGGTIGDLPDSADADGLAGISQMFFVQALAVHAVTEWDGVGDAADNPAAVTESNVEALFRDFPGLAEEFLARYVAPIAEAFAEGNGSAAASNGTSAAAADTANGAGPTASPAPPAGAAETESDAPITKTR